MKKYSPKTVRIIEAFSWYGVVATFSAYMLVSFSIYHPSNIIPVFLNITGCLTMLMDAFKDRNWQPVVLNIAWIVVAVVTYISSF